MSIKPGCLVTLSEPDEWEDVYIPQPPYIVLSIEQYDLADIEDPEWLVDYVEVIGADGRTEKFQIDDLELLDVEN